MSRAGKVVGGDIIALEKVLTAFVLSYSLTT